MPSAPHRLAPHLPGTAIGLATTIVALAALAAPKAQAATLEVGPGKAYALPSQAAAAAHDGDTVLISAGLYPGDACFWQASNLTIRGVGGFAHLAAGGVAAGGKGTWVIQGAATTVEGIEFSGAAVSDLNGAGIRLEGAGLTVRGCWFHDNQEGILAGDNAASDILIEGCEFDHNGAGDGYSHNLYINHVRSLTFRYCYSHRAVAGHELKTRALANYIIANRIMDEDGTGSYTIDVPNGGLTFILGNLIEQGPSSANGGIVTVAEEGGTNPIQHLYLINNTIVNDRAGGTFLAIGAATTLARVENNIFLGPGTAISGTATTNLRNLVTGTDPLLADRAGYDYRLLAGSPAIDAGAAPGSAEGQALLPDRQYVHPCASEARTTTGSAVDLGAYEAAGSSTSPPTVVTPASGPTAPVTGASAALHVLGGPAGNEARYTYTWSVISGPAGGAMTFAPNGTNAAKDATASPDRAGTWTVQVAIADPATGASTTSGPLTLTFSATLASIVVTGPAAVAPDATARFAASALDQFGRALASQPTMAWTASGGSVDGGGLFHAGSAAGTARVTASGGGRSGHLDVAIVASGAPAASGDAGGSGGHHCGAGSGVAALGAAMLLLALTLGKGSDRRGGGAEDGRGKPAWHAAGAGRIIS